MALLIAIDVGGTSAKLALVEAETGLIVRRATVPTPPREAAGAGFLDAVGQAAEQLALSSAIAAVGLSLCELVSHRGAIESGHRVPWTTGGVHDRLGRIAPVTIESDVRAAALAEARLGAGQGYDPFLYLNIGTGIAATLVIGRRPYRGAHGHALVIASGPTTSVCAQCGAISQSVLEDVAGGAGLAAHYRQAAGVSDVDGLEIVRRAGQGEPAACEIIGLAATELASTLGAVLGMIDPAALVVGGGLGAAHGAYFEALAPAIRHHVWSGRTRDIPILQAMLGSDAGLIGAALIHT
jgi:glucokinase